MKVKLCFYVFLFLFFMFSTAHAQESKLDLDLANKIMACESGGKVSAYNPNDGGTPSYSLFQFKLRTFRDFGVIYKVFPEGTTLEEAKKYIWSPAYQGAIAMGMMADGLYMHWKNCYLRSV